MGEISLGLNLEFVRDEDKTFEFGVEQAAKSYDHLRGLM